MFVQKEYVLARLGQILEQIEKVEPDYIALEGTPTAFRDIKTNLKYLVGDLHFAPNSKRTDDLKSGKTYYFHKRYFERDENHFVRRVSATGGLCVGAKIVGDTIHFGFCVTPKDEQYDKAFSRAFVDRELLDPTIKEKLPKEVGNIPEMLEAVLDDLLCDRGTYRYTGQRVETIKRVYKEVRW